MRTNSEINYSFPILVSNGTGVLKHKAGSIINKFDTVVRFNLYRITPEFVPFIGEKTDIWIHNGLPHIIPDATQKAVKNIIIMSNKPWKHRGQIEKEKLRQIFDVADYSHTLRGLSPDPSYTDFSVGLFAIIYLSHHSKTVYCYGFDGMSTPGHYFNHNHSPAQCHVPTIENEIRSKLKSNGLIRDLEDWL